MFSLCIVFLLYFYFFRYLACSAKIKEQIYCGGKYRHTKPQNANTAVNAELNGWIRHLFHDSELLSLSLTTVTIVPLIQWKLSLCLFNCLGIYQAFTTTLEFFDL